VKAKFPVLLFKIELKIGNGSTADYRASPELMIIREAMISPSSDVAMDFRLSAGFLAHRSDAELPAARGLNKPRSQ
jgi:hypothetical protein